MQKRSNIPAGQLAGLEIIYQKTVFDAHCPFAPSHPVVHRPLDRRIQYLHHHNGLEIGWCRTGSGIFFIEDQILPYQAPCASVIYSGQAHIAQSSPSQPAEWYFVNVDDEALGHGWPVQCRKGVRGESILTQSGNGDIVALIEQMIEELCGDGEGRIQCASSLLEAVLYKHLRTGKQSRGDYAHWKLEEIAPAVTYIANHYAESFSVSFLAALCSVSEPTLRRKFVDAVGEPPLQYLHRVRIGAAVNLLSLTAKTMLEICHEVGFESQSSFNRQFLKLTGSSPKQIRKQRPK